MVFDTILSMLTFLSLWATRNRDSLLYIIPLPLRDFGGSFVLFFFLVRTLRSIGMQFPQGERVPQRSLEGFTALHGQVYLRNQAGKNFSNFRLKFLWRMACFPKVISGFSLMMVNDKSV